MKLTAEIRISDSRKLYDIISPEMIKKERSSLDITQEKDAVRITINAKDITAFKTSFYSVVKYLDVAEKMGKR